MQRPADSLLATRRSLVERLVDLEDRRRWQEFFERYWKLIYGVARRAGLSDAEAQDVVQETVITVAKNISKYERTAGSFKNWLLHITRWRIADQFRKRAPGDQGRREGADGSRRETATIERVPDGLDVGAVWQEEWQRHLLENALQRLKRRVDPQHYQIFDCAVLKEWPAAKVARELGVNVARVYLVKHRLASLLKKEIAAVQEHG
jgi:RNA polymerase sigma-70 factor (ECF subfamily)